MKKKNLKKLGLVLLYILSVVFVTTLLFVLFGNSKPTEKEFQIPNGISVEKPSPERIRLLKQYREKKLINKDYLGRIYFESGMIDYPIVTSKDNKDYLKKSFEGKQSNEGTVFLDYRNQLNNQNLILYGHYVYYDESKMFSPLHQLKKKENYEKNSIFYLELENEIRTYQVAYVYYYDMGNKALSYWKTNYKDYFSTYFNLVEKVKMYDTSVEISKNDSFITLQTCVRNRDDLRLIVIGKEIKKEKYE